MANILCVSMIVILSLSLISYASQEQDTVKEFSILKQSQVELNNIQSRISGFKTIPITKQTGEIVVTPEQSLTVEKLRNVLLDDNPPSLGKPSVPYAPEMTDDYPSGEAPYVAKGIMPFRFKYFNCEFNYGGWYNFGMMDYASAHGFNILYPYTRKPEEKTHLPESTEWLKWGGFVDWDKWLSEHNIPAGHYDMLTDINVVDEIVKSKVFEYESGFQYLMIDMEHSYFGLKQLREQAWYPKNGTDLEKQAFEKKYYDGYAMTYKSPVESARIAGWKNISLYGWEPSSRGWWGLEKVNLDPKTDWAWNAYGKNIYESADILNPSVYCFYWSPQNVAYTLANIDLNMKLVNSMPIHKLLRPYYWTLLHGGGSDWRWWTNQPIANEEVKAMIAMGFFTGFDGFDTWNWSGTGSHHAVPPLKTQRDDKLVYNDVMVKDSFQYIPEGADQNAKPFSFKRYDVLHVLDVDEKAETVRFQIIEKDNQSGEYGITSDKPKYVMKIDNLNAHLRPSSEPVSAMIEGMALVKSFEYILRHGEVKIDVSAQKQFEMTSPIVRRVKLGNINVICTYDPMCIYGGEPRQIVLNDFDGNKGLTLKLPADSETRLFVIVEQN
ncbi:MAG: hypothetical protein QG588_2293 [Candidatus Poribacteria bacterium]|nr:hypothetical protein [Candidatus Poribacteria bacterium]